MHYWLINPYGPLPTEDWRSYRFAILGDALARAGHVVTWWTSNFSHHFKTFRSAGWKDLCIRDGFTIRLVPTPGYQLNVGLGRIFRDAVFSWCTYRRGCVLGAPDCIVYSESPLCFGYAGQKLAAYHDVPVVFDQMDLWPDLFELVFPSSVRPLLHGALAPVYWSRRKVYEKLNAVVALARPYLEVALKEAPVLHSRPHSVFYNGVDVETFRSHMLAPVSADEPWPAKQAGEIWAVFAGSLGPSYDIPAILKVAENLKNKSSPLRFIVAGDGPARPDVEAAAAQRGSLVSYVGKLKPDALCRLYNLSDIALCAYSARSNVEMPDKFYDYTAAGLAMVNSLTGEVSQAIMDRKLGLQYRSGDAIDLERALSKLALDHSMRKMMAKNSEEAGSLYDSNVQYAAFVKLLEEVCAKPRLVHEPPNEPL